MVKNSIKIFARLKRENSSKSETIHYHVTKFDKSDTITIRCNNYNGTDFVNNKPTNLKFRFRKIFDQESSQEDIFLRLAKPVVNSVINGYNGTIFAYGQTGSGKTYAITGSSKNYHGRGIIPRSIEEVFKLVNENDDHFSISISYLEIYNEIGYDLLNPKQQVSCMEELPKVMLLEDGKGEAHLRNLSIHRVDSEEEAMRLLYLGDKNRTIAETPMNVYSSRSHCIFTINITWKNDITGKVRRSKLNLVDLAGSERIKKTNITGTTLTEAKYINLSLHYLEQVVTALSQKKIHIPFRNSMLTYMLRDSLSGSCLTVLLATLATNKRNFEETLATCKFAQRVADLSIEAVINNETEPKKEIEFLRSEIEQLQKQIVKQTKYMLSRKLSKDEKEHWKKLITSYLNDNKDDMHLSNCDFRHIQYCFKRLKQTVQEQERQKVKLESAVDSNNLLITQCKNVILQKEKEIHALKSMLFGDENSSKKVSDSKLSNQACSLSETNKENVSPSIGKCFVFTPAQKIAFKSFIENPKNTAELDFYKQSIEDMYRIAGNLNAVVEQCQKNIINMKSKLSTAKNEETFNEINKELINQQTIYKNSLSKLQNLKIESQHFKIRWEQARHNVVQSFIKWCENCNDLDVDNQNDLKSRTSLSSASDTSCTESSKKLTLKEDGSGQEIGTSNYKNQVYKSLKGHACEGLVKSYKNFSVPDVNNNKTIFYENKQFTSFPDNKILGNVQQLKSERPYSNESNKRSLNFKEVLSTYNKIQYEGCKKKDVSQIRTKSKTFSELESILELNLIASDSDMCSSKTCTKYQSEEEINTFSYEIEEVEALTESQKCLNSDEKNLSTMQIDQGEINQANRSSYTFPVCNLTNEETRRLCIIRENYLEDFDNNEYAKLLDISRYPSRTKSLVQTPNSQQKNYQSSSHKKCPYKSTSFSGTNSNTLYCKNGAEFEYDRMTQNIKLSESYDSGIFYPNQNESVNNIEDEDTTDQSDSYKTATETKTLSEKSACVLSDSVDSCNSLELMNSMNNIPNTMALPTLKSNSAILDLFLPTDSQGFKNFIKNVPLTGDSEVDEEIIKFYRAKFVYIIDS